MGRFFELATTKKIYANGLNKHEIKEDVSEDYTGDFEKVGIMLLGENEQKTINKFKNVVGFEN